ncbi:MAG: hypothetical protein HY560_07595 [Gemmatimonadetes bacterium]|nr:hypothetical protein [Gemmatimonadota bacterium]
MSEATVRTATVREATVGEATARTAAVNCADGRPRPSLSLFPPSSFSPVAFLTVALITLGLSLPSCARHGDVIRMSRNVVGGYGPKTGELVLNLEKTVRGDSARYQLFVGWTSYGPVGLERGMESLILTADGERIAFRLPPESRLIRDSNCYGGPCIYEERAYYPVTVDQIRKIAGARRQVTVTLTGTRNTIAREFHEMNFERFQTFVAENVPAP